MQNIRQLAQELEQKSQGPEWFEELYARGAREGFDAPWAERRVNPWLSDFVKKHPEVLVSPAIVVGCGLGDDASWLAKRGVRTLGIDISRTAIDICYKRYTMGVEFRVVDLLALPPQLVGTFPFVFEAYTIQSLREPQRQQAIRAVASLVAPGGRLLVIQRGRDEDEPSPTMPWPLTRDEFAAFVEAGLTLHSFEDFSDDEEPPKRRFRALYRRRPR